MGAPLVVHAIEGAVGEISLNRPDAGNAMNLALLEALDEATAAICGNRRTRAILLRGEGRHFCVGGDITAFAERDGAAASMERLVRPLHRIVLRLANHAAPVIVAAQGASAGAGLSLVACADVAIAARSASFTMAYTAIGLTADAAATWFLPRVVGLRRAQELAFGGRRLSAEEAESWGLVTQVVDDNVLVGAARRVAERLAAGPTQAFGAIKRLLATQSGASLSEHLDAEARAIVAARGRADAQEGIEAFLGRRPPRFEGA